MIGTVITVFFGELHSGIRRMLDETGRLQGEGGRKPLRGRIAGSLDALIWKK
jgi:hypothetical protein